MMFLNNDMEEKKERGKDIGLVRRKEIIGLGSGGELCFVSSCMEARGLPTGFDLSWRHYRRKSWLPDF